MFTIWNDYNIYIIIAVFITIVMIYNKNKIDRFNIYKNQRDKYLIELEDQLQKLENVFNVVANEGSTKKLEKKEKELYRKYNHLISNLDSYNQNNSLHDINLNMYFTSMIMLVSLIYIFLKIN